MFVGYSLFYICESGESLLVAASLLLLFNLIFFILPSLTLYTYILCDDILMIVS
jgi:hypothetical protein